MTDKSEYGQETAAYISYKLLNNVVDHQNMTLPDTRYVHYELRIVCYDSGKYFTAVF